MTDQSEIIIAVGIIVIVAAILVLYYYSRLRKEAKVKETPKLEVVEVKEKVSVQPLELTMIKGIGPKWSSRLKEVGVNSVQDLASMKADEVAKKIGASEKVVSKWIAGAKEILKKKSK